jgi:WD40-like Beta Propeller Repeat
MKRSWTALAVAILTLGVLAGCNDYNNTVQYNTGATITNLSPSTLPAGTPTGAVANCPNTPTSKTNPCFTILVVALSTNGFQSNTLVAWNQNKLPACALTNGNPNPNATNGCSTYVDGTDMAAYIPYSLIQKPGTSYVNTYTPQSGTGNNGLSNALSFIVYGGPNPFPQISSLSPTSGNYCAYSTTSSCGSVSITLNSVTSGSGGTFLPTSQNGGSQVIFTGLATYGIPTAINIASLSSTQIKATIPGTYLCATDTVEIDVKNPGSATCITNCPNVGGGYTNCTTSDPSVQEPNPCTVTTQKFTITGTAGANTCPAQSPPNPNPTAVAAETPAISQDGRFVAYAAQQNGGTTQILLRDTCVGAAKECTPSTETISVNSEGTVANGESHDAVMSSDGRYVAFSSAATNLAANPPTGRQVYLRDTCQGAASTCKPATTLVSVDEEGKLGGTEAILPSISTSGRFIAFLAVTPSQTAKGSAANTGVNSGLRQVFVRDTCLGATNCTPSTTRISMLPGDAPAGASKPAGPAVAGLARQLALTDTKSSTVFTPTVPIDDEVFLAIRAKQ